MVQPGYALDGGGVDHREVQLLFVGPKAVEQVENLVYDPVGPRTRPVHLVYYHDGIKALLESLGGHEAGLRHGAVHGVHQQQHGVNHGQYALHLATEVGVPRGIDNIDTWSTWAMMAMLRSFCITGLPLPGRIWPWAGGADCPWVTWGS